MIMVRFLVFMRMVDVLDMISRKNSILTDTVIDYVFFVRLLPCGCGCHLIGSRAQWLRGRASDA